VVPALGGAQRMERLDDRDAAVAGRGQGSQAAGPADRVHDVGLVVVPDLGQRVGERADVRQYVFVGQRLSRSGRDVPDGGAAVQSRALGQVLGVLAGVHRDLVLLAGQFGGQRGDPGLLDGGFAARGVRKSGGVFGNEGDLHGVLLLAASDLSLRPQPQRPVRT
jgi:hypothetical protein